MEKEIDYLPSDEETIEGAVSEESIEKGKFKILFSKIKTWLGHLSFRTGVIVLLSCIPFYIISFAQFALPIDMGIKTALWVIFFGLAKTAQYGGLTILGAKGVGKLRQFLKLRKKASEENQIL